MLKYIIFKIIILHQATSEYLLRISLACTMLFLVTSCLYLAVETRGGEGVQSSSLRWEKIFVRVDQEHCNWSSHDILHLLAH